MHYNINDPNLIPYFNGDEGYRMDVIGATIVVR